MLVDCASARSKRRLRRAGPTFVGGDEIVKKIQDGWLDFEAVVATPDMMRSVGKLGRRCSVRGG